MKKFVLIVLPFCLAVGIFLLIRPSSLVIARNVVSAIFHNIERKTTTVEGQTWVYNKSGKGDTLLLLHGFGASKESWNDIIHELSDNFCVIAPDLPGYGASSFDSAESYTIKRQTERLNALIDNLGIQHLHLAGNSMGGAIAGNYASNNPGRIKSLWLIAPYGVEQAEKSELDRHIEQKGDNIMVVHSVEDYDTLMQWLYHTPPQSSWLTKSGIVELINNNPAQYKKLHKDLMTEREPLEQVLDKFNGAVLITWGRNDRLTHISGAKVLKNALPQAVVHRQPYTGHVPMMENPSLTASQFAEFVAAKKL